MLGTILLRSTAGVGGGPAFSPYGEWTNDDASITPQFENTEGGGTVRGFQAGDFIFTGGTDSEFLVVYRDNKNGQIYGQLWKYSGGTTPVSAGTLRDFEVDDGISTRVGAGTQDVSLAKLDATHYLCCCAVDALGGPNNGFHAFVITVSGTSLSATADVRKALAVGYTYSGKIVKVDSQTDTWALVLTTGANELRLLSITVNTTTWAVSTIGAELVLATTHTSNGNGRGGFVKPYFITGDKYSLTYYDSVGANTVHQLVEYTPGTDTWAKIGTATTVALNAYGQGFVSLNDKTRLIWLYNSNATANGLMTPEIRTYDINTTANTYDNESSPITGSTVSIRTGIGCVYDIEEIDANVMGVVYSDRDHFIAPGASVDVAVQSIHHSGGITFGGSTLIADDDIGVGYGSRTRLRKRSATQCVGALGISLIYTPSTDERATFWGRQFSSAN